MVAPAIVGAAIGAGASLLGDVHSAKQSAKQARLNREFQERMSSTAYQRAADDLEAAGLNRVLALGSPASTPGGAMGQVPSMGSAIAHGAQAGYGLASTAQDIKQSEAQIKKILSESKLLDTKQKTELAKSDVFQQIAPIIAQAGKDFGTLVEFIRDPARLDEITHLLGQAQGNILDYIDTLLGEIYGSRYKGSEFQNIIQIGKEQ